MCSGANSISSGTFFRKGFPSTLEDLCRRVQNKLIFNKNDLLQFSASFLSELCGLMGRIPAFNTENGGQTLLEEPKFCIFCLTFQTCRRFCEFVQTHKQNDHWKSIFVHYIISGWFGKSCSVQGYYLSPLNIPHHNVTGVVLK